MNRRKQTRHSFFVVVAVVVGLALCAATTCAQDNATPASTAQAAGASPVPRLIKFSGTINPQITQIRQNETQSPGPSRAIDFTFSLYELQEGGAPLWSESQKVQPDDQGHYTVLLGSTQPEGLPLDLFTTGKAQWVGVQPQLPGAGEQARVLLVGMPYALKASDADTLGGLPASAFLQAGAQAYESAAAATTGSTSLATQAATGQTLPAAPGGSGTTDFLPLWTNSTTLGNSVLFQSGTGSTAKVGLNTTTPASTLDVNGAGTVRGTLSLPPTGTATGTAGKNSQPASLQASAYNSSTHAAVNQTFNLQAEPVANDTASPSGKLNLLFASGSATPAETGLSIASNGQIKFASGQTFPGAGTITGVTAGTDLTGGGTSGTVTLNLDTTKVPLLSTSNTFKGNQSVTGNVSATKQLISTVATGTAPLSVNSTTQVPNLNASLLGGLGPSAFAQTGIHNSFVAGQTFAGNGMPMYVGDPQCGPGYAGIGFGALSGCNNYSLLGDSKNTYINRPAGGTLYFREGNASEMTISPGGGVSIAGYPASSSPANAALYVTSTQDGSDGLESDGGGSASEFANGGRGLVARGGSESNTSTIAGDGIWAFGGTADQGGVGIYVQAGDSRAVGGADGIDVYAGDGNGANGYSGWFRNGDVEIDKNLAVGGAITAGTKDFLIDHPLDPANKYLYHASVESSEMLTIYSGNVTTDSQGDAVVTLPDWFESLNRDFRYQLTCMGQFAQAIVASKIAGNRFTIKTDKPNVDVSWQVTGVRHDAFAEANPLVVEVDKPANERGFYLRPALYGQPAEKQIEWGRNPRKLRHLQELRAKAEQRARLAQTAKP